MTDLLFASAHVERLAAEAALPSKFQRLLEQADLGSRLADKRVAIKMHVGGGLGYTTLHPIFVRAVVDAVKAAGGKSFLTDGSFSSEAAVARGYTPEVVGARVVGAGGEHDQYFYPRTTEVPGLPEIELCGNIVDADALIVLNHGKGHGNSGFGGAIKNIAMGCVTYRTRGRIHALMSSNFHWDEELCTHCEQCVQGCPVGAVSFSPEGKLSISDHHCRWCLHCTYTCPTQALTMEEPGEKFALFQQGMAAVVKETLACFEPAQVFYLTALLSITPLCDCWGFSTPALVPDVGILGGNDIVAMEQAALDLIKWEDLIPSAVPEQMCPLGEEGHLFQRLHGKDPYEQVRQAEAMGLGSAEYGLVEVK